MADDKPVIPLSTKEAYDHNDDVEFDSKNREPWREHQQWLKRCHALAMREQYAITLSVEQADVLYAYAWEEGHAYGFGEVEGKYADLADVVEKILAL